MNGKLKISSFTLIVAFLCAALVGLALLPFLPVKLSPSRVLPQIKVTFRMPDNSARVIEMEVTSKLESMLSRVKGIKDIHSQSGNGWGDITLYLDKHTNMEAARFEVSAIIRQSWSSLPENVSYPAIQMNRPDEEASRPFIIFIINSPATPASIRKYTEEVIKPAIGSIKGIYQINISGATPMEWQLKYDSQQLEQLKVTVEDIQKAISQYYRKEYLGIANVQEQEGTKQWIRVAVAPTEENNKLLSVSEIYVSNKNGKLIRLDQLVKVTHIEATPQSYYRINGLNSIYLSIVAEETANQLSLSGKVCEEINKLKTHLPDNYEINIGYNATEYIQQELDKIYVRSGLTILILLLFVLLMTRNFRYLLLIVITIIINLLIAVIFYYLLKLEIQLYSLAGITISLSLIIDCTIVMTDHIRHRHNLKAYLSILAATLTTIGSLMIIYFLNENIKINLQDFASVVIINLLISLLIALFFVPALMEKLGLGDARIKKSRFPKFKRFEVYITKGYKRTIRFGLHHRIIASLIFVLAFGLPVFMLPDKIEEENYWGKMYNQTLGSNFYKEKIRPFADKALGGTLRLFADKVYNGSYWGREGETVLYVNATLPNGSTLEQMNTLMERMEAYLSGFDGIKQFQTDVHNARRGSIRIYFTKENQKSGFPYVLKSNIISKAFELGGGSWSVYGLEDQGFSNDVRENAGSFRVKLAGYNYDELYAYAEKLKSNLLTYRRIKEVLINSEFSWWKDDYQEFNFDLNKQHLIESGLTPMELFSSIGSLFAREIACGTIVTDEGRENIKLSSAQSSVYDDWNMLYLPLVSERKNYKLCELAEIKKEQQPQKIVKNNQQYCLCLQYEYIGAVNQGQKVLEKELEIFNATLPMGYTAKSESNAWGWGSKDNKQYLLLFLIIAIIFVITSILFNSLRQPFAVIFVIPISYIGVFLTFYLFKLNFDQGGFASFVLLCGITVNASIYILNEYNNIRKQKPHISLLQAYLKAWNAKMTPIFLTIISTILGFIPFMVGTEKEAFWFPLAAGTIGGLIMSLLGIFIYLPLFTLKHSAIHPE